MGKRLIVNADDFGYAPEVSSGILEAHREGIVTSTTAMVNRPDIGSQLAEALALPNLGVGLHLVFTSGRPLLPAGRLAGFVGTDGRFLDHHILWSRMEDLPAKRLEAEFEAQVRRFIELAGRPPDHLDCHHFIHVYPPIFQMYAGLGQELNLPVRIPFPLQTDFQQAPWELPYLEGFPADLVRSMIVTNSAAIKSRGLRHPDHFVASFFGRLAVSYKNLIRLLASLPEGTTELMCHPGNLGPGLRSSSYREQREEELRSLVHPKVREFVAEQGIELITFRDL